MDLCPPKVSDDGYFWYHRAHHIGVDGYGGGLIARRVAELYTDLAEGRDPAPASFWYGCCAD